MYSRVFISRSRSVYKLCSNREVLSICNQQVIYFSNGKLANFISSTDSNVIKDRITSKKDIFQRKLNDLVNWYESFTGLDEVRLAQQRVLDAQDSFVAAQEGRREIHRQLTTLQSNLKDIHNEIQRTSRGEERYLDLVTEEHKIIREEREKATIFRDLEKQEREYFTNLSNAVKTSHERERLQADKTKYWSLIASVIGTIIGIIGTTINNSFKMREIRDLVKQSSIQAQQLLMTTLNDSQTISVMANKSQINEKGLINYLQRIEMNINKLLKLQNVTVEKVSSFGHKDTEVSFESKLNKTPEDQTTYIVVGGLLLATIVILLSMASR